MKNVNDKMLSYDELKSELDYYIAAPSSKYAVMVSGEWGCGKTYMLKNLYLPELDKKYRKNNKNNKKPIYVTLNGINDIEEVKNKIFIELSNDSVLKKASPIVNLASLAFEVINKETGETIKKGYTELLNKMVEIKNIVIFFDDLERCKIEITEILGFINDLVENYDAKVIIIADEDKINKNFAFENIEQKYLVALKLLESESESEENIDYIEKMKLIKKDIFDGDEKYKSIKEKTIFKTLNVKNDIKTIIDVFNEKIIKINDLKIIIDNKKEWLIEKLNEFEHNNIRTLQFVFESFNRLGKTILTVDFKENEGNQKKVLTELFEYLVIKSIHVKKGINRYSWKERQEFGEICLSNEEHSNYTDYIKGFRFVDDYIINSYFNKEYIIKVTKDYLNNINDFETDKDLKVIERYWIHSENELKESIENITKKIRKNQYSVNYYSQILIKLSCIEVWEVAISEIHEAVEAMENNIKNGLVKGELCDAYAYEISDKEQSKKYSEYFERLKKSFQKSKVTQTIEEIDNIMAKANSGEELKEYCYSNEIFFRENESFLSFIKSDLLVQKLQGDQIEDIYNFRYIIQRIYKGNKAEIYIFDKSLVENLIYKLNKMTIEDKVRKHAIDLLIKELQGIQF
jgi:hypothetical protein